MKYEPAYYVQKYKTHIIIGAIAIILAMIIFAITSTILTMREREGKYPVPLSVLPEDATITIDGKTHTRKNTVYLAPGTYQLTAEKDGFTRSEQEVIINEQDETAIFVQLVAESDEAKKWQERNHRRYMRFEAEAGKFAKENGAALRARLPIINTLPIRDPYFTIGYRLEENGEIILTIKGVSPRYREFAIDELRSKGFEPTEYRIEFSNFNNPLAKDAEQKESRNE